MRRLIERTRVSLIAARRPIRVGPGTTVALTARLDASGGGAIRIGARCEIGHGALLDTHGGVITLGDECSVNPYAVLYGHGGLTIGAGVRIAAHVVLVPGNHGIARDRPIRVQAQSKQGITVEDDVWIGAGARILDGVTLARGCVVGAGAVVTRSTSPYSINVGVPAREIGTRG